MTDAPGLCAEDRWAIHDLLARYNWAVDTDDAAAFAATFTDDGEFVTDARTYTGHAAMRELMERLRAKRTQGERSLFHHVANVVLEPTDGEQVRFVAQLLGPRVSADGVTSVQLGWYDDVVARTPRGWRFARRHFRHWSDGAPAVCPVPFPEAVS